MSLHFVGAGGRIAGYDVLILPDLVVVSRDGAEVVRHAVPNHGTGIGELAQRPGFRLGWGRFPDGAAVVYCYERDDACFGYPVNLAASWCSKWGFAPFAADEAAA